jgi:hypothetical protein
MGAALALRASSILSLGRSETGAPATGRRRCRIARWGLSA